MERPSREAIETLMNITGVSEVVAAQKLEENWGDLNAAINAHFTEDRSTITSTDAACNVPAGKDDYLNPFSDPDFSGNSLIVSHWGEGGEIPIELRYGTEQSNLSVLAPTIDGLGGKSDAVDIPNALSGDSSGQNWQKDDALHDSSNTSDMGTSHGMDEFVYNNDVEEAMVQATIKASRRDRGKDYLDLQSQSLLEEALIEQAVSLSLKTAEQEKALRELCEKVATSEPDTYKSTVLGDLRKMTSLDGRLDVGSLSIQHGTPNLVKEQQDDDYLASLQADREKELKAMEEAEAQRLEEQKIRESTLEEERLKEEASLRKLEEEQGIKKRLSAKEASLPQEQTSEDNNQSTIQVRMPDGSRHVRRFLMSEKLQSIFDFIDAGGWVKPGTYRLVRPYTQCAFSNEETALTLNELGFNSEKEVVFLELI